MLAPQHPVLDAVHFPHANETWLWIPGYEGGYAVSDQGRVFSFYCKRVLKPGCMSGGHMSVALGRGNSRCLHDLVLSAFVGPRPKGYDGRHLNGNPADNRKSNLEWSTRSRNSQDKKWHAGAKTYKLSAQDIMTIKYLIADGIRLKDIAASYGVHSVTIGRIKNGRSHTDVA
jgi:hypothetical protein